MDDGETDNGQGELSTEVWECRACGKDAPCRVEITHQPTKFPHIEAQPRFANGWRSSCICDEKLVTDWRRMDGGAKTVEGAMPQDTVGDIVHPIDGHVTEEMLRFARTDSACHFAANLNAMMMCGYCNQCGLTPNGCEREGCRANARINRRNTEAK